MPDTTPRWGHRYSLGTDSPPDVAQAIKNLALDLDSVAIDDQGPILSRPTSTPASPGKKGRYYYATDEGVLYRDSGTAWVELFRADAAVQAGLNTAGVKRRGACFVPAPQTRTNTAYGLLDTPDMVEDIVLPNGGLMFIAYHATWREQVANAGRAGVFLGANQVVMPTSSNVAVPLVEALLGTAGIYAVLSSASTGLESAWGTSIASEYPGDAATGHLVSGGLRLDQDTDGSNNPHYTGGFMTVAAAPGTYDVSVQFKSTSGDVSAKNRKLWVWTAGF